MALAQEDIEFIKKNLGNIAQLDAWPDGIFGSACLAVLIGAERN